MIFEERIKLAEQGDINTLFNLACDYQISDSVTQNFSKAVK